MGSFRGYLQKTLGGNLRRTHVTLSLFNQLPNRKSFGGSFNYS